MNLVQLWIRALFVSILFHFLIIRVSIGLCTAIVGVFGMNLPLPQIPNLFGSSSEFGTVMGVSLLIPIGVYVASFSYSMGVGLKQVKERRAEQLSALQSIFLDIGAVCAI